MGCFESDFHLFIEGAQSLLSGVQFGAVHAIVFHVAAFVDGAYHDVIETFRLRIKVLEIEGFPRLLGTVGGFEEDRHGVREKFAAQFAYTCFACIEAVVEIAIDVEVAGFHDLPLVIGNHFFVHVEQGHGVKDLVDAIGHVLFSFLQFAQASQRVEAS